MEFVSLESLQESNHLLKICQQNSQLFDGWTYIGGLTTVGGSRTEWYWVDNGKKLSFELNFAAGQPDNAGNNELCLSIGNLGIATGNFFFNDNPCYGWRPYRFICQTKEAVY